MSSKSGYRGFSLVLAIGLAFTEASIPLETETARTIRKHGFEGAAAFEYQKSSEGLELAVPLAFEYGILENLELLVEPVLYTAILPDTGRKATGIGDLEITLNYRFLEEQGALPAFGAAGEAKVALADDMLIGTGKSDFAAYFIASKRLGGWDVHGNLGYTWVGQPTGIKDPAGNPIKVRLNDLMSFSLAAEQIRFGKLQLLGEVSGNTPSFFQKAGNAPENPITPEASGGELVGTVGARYFFKAKMAATLGLSYDNSNALLVAPGFIVGF